MTDLDANVIFVADLRDELVFTSTSFTGATYDMEYDSVTRKIYWSDQSDHRVYRAYVDNGSNREAVTRSNTYGKRYKILQALFFTEGA